MDGDKLLPKKGFYRPSNNTDYIFKCINSESCLGGIKYVNDTRNNNNKLKIIGYNSIRA